MEWMALVTIGQAAPTPADLRAAASVVNDVGLSAAAGGLTLIVVMALLSVIICQLRRQSIAAERREARLTDALLNGNGTNRGISGLYDEIGDLRTTQHAHGVAIAEHEERLTHVERVAGLAPVQATGGE